METRVLFYLDQDLGPGDLEGVQEGVAGTFDDLVGDAISSNYRFAGLTVTKSATVSKIGVAPGTLYVLGKMYDAPAAQVHDFLTALPQVGNKWVVVVALPDEVKTDVTPREFLLDEATGQSQAKPVATRLRRVCLVQYAVGDEAPSPTLPIVSPGYTPVANVLLGPSGVISIEMREDYRLGNLDEHKRRIGDLEEFEEAVGARVETLTSDLAALARQAGGQVPLPLIGQLLTRVADIEARQGIPTAAVSSRAAYFLDDRDSDLAHALSNCQVKEGIRFPDANRDEVSIELLNPLDPLAKLSNGVLLPKYTRQAVVRLGKPTDEIRLSGYSYQTNEMVQKTISREVINYGPVFTPCTNSGWWETGKYDARKGIFERNGETFKIEATVINNGLLADGRIHNLVRAQKYWKSTVQEKYWESVATDHAVNGTVVAETFLQAQDMWLESVGLIFKRLADAGDVRVVICEATEGGTPNLKAVLAQTTLPRSAMKSNAETNVPLTPTFLTGGKRYALVLITAGDHYAATVPAERFTQGTLFAILDGAYAQSDGERDLWFELYRAVPTSPRTSINMRSLNLDGGILGIEINADVVVPPNCRAIHEIQVAGRWYDLASVDEYMLGQGGAVQPLLPYRITFLGTGDIMPGVVLDGSQITLSRPGTAFLHVGAVRALPGAGSSQIRIIHRYESWDGLHHTAGVKLRTGATFATLVSPSSFSDVTGTDPFAGPYLERTYVFNLGSAVTAFKVQTEGVTDTNKITYHVASHKDYAL